MKRRKIPRLTRHQIEACERHWNGTGDSDDASTYSKARGRLRQAKDLVDMSVREALLAVAENRDPTAIIDLAQEAVDRMGKSNQRWFREWFNKRWPLRFGNLGVPQGAAPRGAVGDFLLFHPEVVKLVTILAGGTRWKRDRLLTEASKKGLSKRRAGRWLRTLEDQGTVETIEKIVPRPGRRGRPRILRYLSLTEGGRHFSGNLPEMRLGPGGPPDPSRRPH